MRVLVVLPNLRRGGAESLAVETACTLTREARAQVEIAVLQGDNAYAARLSAAGVPVHDLGLRHRYDVAGAPRLASLVRERRIDVLHAHLLPALIPSVFAHQRTGRPLVMTEHSVWNRRRRIRAFRHFESWLYARVDRVLCVSDSVRKALQSWLPEAGRRAEVLYNGVAIRPLGERPAAAYDVIFVGNLDRPAKGADILLHALAACGSDVARACFVGEGRLRPELERLRDALGLNAKVDFVGSSDRVGELLEKSRLFVLPSRWEGLPMALLEAMERGLPVVASNVGGVPEVVTSGRDGLLISPDDVDAVATSIVSMLRDDACLERIGSAARRRVEEGFSLDVSSRRLCQQYADLRGQLATESSRSASA